MNCGRFCFWRYDFFVCVWNISGTAERICAKFTRKTCLVPRSEGSGKVEGQGQRSRSPGTKTTFFDPFGGLRAVYVWLNIFSLVTTRSELRKVLFLAWSVCGFCVFVYEISRESLNGFAPNSHGRRGWSLARIRLKVKIRVQRSRSP